jgi:hypothetical protein
MVKNIKRDMLNLELRKEILEIAPKYREYDFRIADLIS